MANPYAPPGESAADLWLEKSNLDGAFLGGVAYGAHIAVFAQCFYTIATRLRSGKDVPSRSRWLLGFITVLFAMGSLNIACNTKMTQLMFIDNRGYPGGPNAWFFANYNYGVNTAGNAAYAVSSFLADGILLWRTYIVWNRLWIVAFPSLVYLASTAMSIMVVIQSSRPNGTLWSSSTVQFTLPYFVFSISLNLMLTLLLVGRLLYMSHRTKKALGAEHGAAYISIAAMLVESATPFAVTSVIFIITYAQNSNVQNLILPVLGQIMCINPEVIILRVATGRAVSSRGSSSGTRGATATTMKFKDGVVGRQDTSRSPSEASEDPTLAGPGSMTFASKSDIFRDLKDTV
ncbi:hypothetical protein C8Q78DRAFT_378708 [Trametes maxima]|nr:hypothetical protein C8Q78DRAFT_378708 [Trametes maxima]